MTPFWVLKRYRNDQKKEEEKRKAGSAYKEYAQSRMEGQKSISPDQIKTVMKNKKPVKIKKK
jgi:hypothetical protein